LIIAYGYIPRYNDVESQLVMDTVMKWVYSFAEYVESEAEYNFSKRCLKEYLREKKNVLGQGLASSVDEILTSFFAKERYVCHHAFMGCTHFNFKGDSIVEAENAIHKKKQLQTRRCQILHKHRCRLVPKGT